VNHSSIQIKISIKSKLNSSSEFTIYRQIYCTQNQFFIYRSYVCLIILQINIFPKNVENTFPNPINPLLQTLKLILFNSESQILYFDGKTFLFHSALISSNTTKTLFTSLPSLSFDNSCIGTQGTAAKSMLKSSS
jgi:hypothetical protein